MEASKELVRIQEKINDGSLSPNEPLFILRAQDITASEAVYKWVELAKEAGATEEKINEAILLAMSMDLWPTKQVPGRPETRKTTPNF